MSLDHLFTPPKKKGKKTRNSAVALCGRGRVGLSCEARRDVQRRPHVLTRLCLISLYISIPSHSSFSTTALSPYVVGVVSDSLVRRGETSSDALTYALELCSVVAVFSAFLYGGNAFFYEADKVCLCLEPGRRSLRPIEDHTSLSVPVFLVSSCMSSSFPLFLVCPSSVQRRRRMRSSCALGRPW